VSDLARITIRRRVDWIDTDAAGIFHWTTVFRMAEAAEAALHTALGLAERTFGVTPRVRVECDFHASARFNDLLDVQLNVTRVGRTSLTQRLRLTRDQTLIADGEITMCFVDAESGGAAPWPDDIRELLETAGECHERESESPEPLSHQPG
jgi:YbgC/YbaW family acyl-CoA thioester hydrolase